MTASLYDRLVEAEDINRELADAREDYMSAIQPYSGLPGFSGTLELEQSRVDTAEMQRQIIEEYSGNSILQRAMDNTEGIEEAVRRLSAGFHWLGKWAPRRYDRKHNKELKELSDLVGDVYCWKKRGLWFYDNAITLTTYVGAGLFAVVYATVRITMPDIEPSSGTVSANDLGIILGTIVGGSIGTLSGLLFPSVLRSDSNHSYTKAQYIDDTLFDLKLMK